MSQKRFAIRTVKAGRVLINGRVYKPSDQFLAYDGRLDGKRFAFGLYPLFNFVSLWGTEDEYRDEYRHVRPTLPPNYIVEGTLPWVWWHAVAPLAREETDANPNN